MLIFCRRSSAAQFSDGLTALFTEHGGRADESALALADGHDVMLHTSQVRVSRLTLLFSFRDYISAQCHPSAAHNLDSLFPRFHTWAPPQHMCLDILGHEIIEEGSNVCVPLSFRFLLLRLHQPFLYLAFLPLLPPVLALFPSRRARRRSLPPSLPPSLPRSYIAKCRHGRVHQRWVTNARDRYVYVENRGPLTTADISRQILCLTI